MISLTCLPPEIDQAEGFSKRSTCKHKWQPLTFRFESDVLMPDASGALRPAIRQPSTVSGRVYCVCMKCASHTYVATQWIGFYLGGDYAEQQEDEPAPGV